MPDQIIVSSVDQIAVVHDDLVKTAFIDMDQPIAKKLLFGADTGTANYEGVCQGPALANGDRTLVMVSDGGDADDERLYALRMKEGRE